MFPSEINCPSQYDFHGGENLNSRPNPCFSTDCVQILVRVIGILYFEHISQLETNYSIVISNYLHLESYFYAIGLC
jgi:hypothetical protein